MKNQILHLAIFKLFVFALLATENLQIHFFFESLIFNFAFRQNVVSKSNAASSSSPRCAPPPARHPARQRGPARASVCLSVRPSIRPSVRPPARSWQAWLPFGCCCCPSLHNIFFPSLDLPNYCCRVSQGCQIFHSSLRYQNSLSLTASVITTSVCLCTVSIGP
jgi:hypothetical protein